MEEKVLFSGVDEILLGQICQVLEENNIKYIKNEYGAGEYMTVVMGESINEKRIIVSSEEYGKAQKLIEPLINASESDIAEDSPQELEEDSEMEKENNKTFNKYKILRRSLGILILGLPLVAIICIIIVAMTQ